MYQFGHQICVIRGKYTGTQGVVLHEEDGGIYFIPRHYTINNVYTQRKDYMNAVEVMYVDVCDIERM